MGALQPQRHHRLILAPLAHPQHDVVRSRFSLALASVVLGLMPPPPSHRDALLMPLAGGRSGWEAVSMSRVALVSLTVMARARVGVLGAKARDLKELNHEREKTSSRPEGLYFG